MPHSTGQQLARSLLAVLALASPLLVQANDDKLAPVVDLNPRHNEAASDSLEEPKALIVSAEVVPLLSATASPTGPPSNLLRKSTPQLKPSKPQPAVRSAHFDPTTGTESNYEATLADAWRDTTTLAPVVRVYGPIYPAQQTRFSNSTTPVEAIDKPSELATTRSPISDPVHRSNELATSPARLAAQSHSDSQSALASAPRLSGFIQFAEQDPVSGKLMQEKVAQSSPRSLKLASPRRPTPVVLQAPSSPIAARETETAMASSPLTERSPTTESASANQPSVPREQTFDVADALPERSSSIVKLATSPIVAPRPIGTLARQPMLASKPGPVLKLAEETLPERPASSEANAQALVPTPTAKPIIQLAKAEPLLAVLQPSPSASDLPAPAAEPALTDEQIAVAKGIAAFELDVKPINELSVRTKPEVGELPRNYAATRFAREGEVAHRMGTSRANMETMMMWEAPASCHRPLYFEETNLERHGYKVPLVQPALSAAHFFGRVPLLPYMMVSDNHRDCQYTLGHYRPGDYAPYSLYVPRLRLDASAAEAMVVAGVLFAFP